MSTDLLPVLYENVPAMTTCAFCPDPGHCCKSFYLFAGEEAKGFWRETWRTDAKHWLESRNLPFEPDQIRKVFVDPDSGQEYVDVLFRCDHLTSEGRCGIYAERPQLCRTFLPGSSRLCVFGDAVHSGATSVPIC